MKFKHGKDNFFTMMVANSLCHFPVNAVEFKVRNGTVPVLNCLDRKHWFYINGNHLFLETVSARETCTLEIKS